MKPLFTTFVLVLIFFIYYAKANAYTTIANGNWQNSSIWAGGSIPDPENIQNQTININHKVTVQNNNVKLVLNAKLYVNNAELIINNGNLIIDYGTVAINNSIIIIGGGHNLELTTCNARLEAINSMIEISQNFTNDQGYRILNYVCLNVHENYQNNNGIDSLINVEAIIGSNSSGNFQNSAGLFYSDNSTFHLPNGNFQNQSGSLLNGNISALWLENGNLENSGAWWADIGNYCVSANVSIPASNLPATQNCSNISLFFNSGLCCPAGSSPNNCVITGPDVLCPGSSMTYTVNVAGNYFWQVSGDATITGSSSNAQVQVTAAQGCNSSFTLTLNITGSCTYTCTKTVAVIDTILPYCECPPVTSVPCGAPIIFTQPVITDNCGTPTIFVYDTYIIPQSDGTNFHVRVWQATDLCGNTILSSQGIIELCGPAMITSIVDPNPFESETYIHFIPVNNSDNITVEVYDINGSKVVTLFSGPAKANEVYNVVFNAGILPDGIYIYRIFDENKYTYGKMVLTK
jgi:hypothetical protein